MRRGHVVVLAVGGDGEAVRPEQLSGIEADAMIALEPCAVRTIADDGDVVVALGGDENHIRRERRVTSGE